MKILHRISIGLLVIATFSACGVKGPPLPPVADTPDASEREDKESARATPTPTPTPSPSAKPKKKKTSQ